MARILLMISLAAASLAAKDRAWQSGTLLDKTLNPYFRPTSSSDAKSVDGPHLVGELAVSVNVHRSTGDVVYDDYVVEGGDTVYAVEVTRFKNTKAPHLSLSLPLNFAVEKSRLYIKDLDRQEFEAQILNQVEKSGTKKPDIVAAAQAKPAPVPAKPNPVVVASVQTPAPKTPSPAASQPAAPPVVPVVAAAAPKPAPKLEAKSTPVPQPQPAVKPAQKPEPVATLPKGSSKDRAWQSGQLLMVVSNKYFLNVTYSSDSDGSGWPFVQGSDGRYTVNGQIGNPTSSLYTYDNYVIESQYCVYLVQRMRPKTSAAARLPGNKPLKFAVEKNKLWVVDEENIEYETKVIKLVQKDSIVNPVTRAAAQ